LIINTNVPPNVDAEIDARASAAHISKAAIIRQVMCQWYKGLNDNEGLAPQ